MIIMVFYRILHCRRIYIDLLLSNSNTLIELLIIDKVQLKETRDAISLSSLSDINNKIKFSFEC